MRAAGKHMNMKMDAVIDFTPARTRSSTHRQTIIKIINDELYPEEQFPQKHFPNIRAILLNLFMESIKSQQDLQDIYYNGKETRRIKKTAKEILNFKNILQNHPQTVVLIYRKYIEKFILFKYSDSDPAEREDIFQEVLTRLIEDKIYKIQQKYDFNKMSSFTSYFMVTVRNIYIDIIRERNVRPLTAGGVQEIDDVADRQGDNKMINRLMINEELVKLQTILLLYYKTRARLELCLKLKYRIPVCGEDVKECFPQCSDEDINTLAQDFTLTRDKRMFEKILPVFNRHESRQNQSDTLRKWVNVKVDEIVTHLNRTHKIKVYSAKNFADFIALYYQNIKGRMGL
jgi:DNA-directed RNA polymerase specialized sigma24 family protein